MLSARGQEADKIEALEAGADDYVTKPFGIGEVRSPDHGAPPAIRQRDRRGVRRAANGSIALDPARRVATVDDTELDLTPREYELLKQMLASPGAC